ncbi:MAG: endonuclease [Saprospiraceae bacterium]|nr:MAG: endonuclease [Saprospiraceae bacterium]
MFIKVGVFGAIISGLFFVFNQFTGTTNTSEPEETEQYLPTAHYLPTSSTGQIVKHEYYTLSYSEEHEQAEWTAHILTKENLDKEWQKREDNFRPDDKVKTGSSTPNDYRGSGYDRGHLVPSADMAFDQEAMKETFLMSNISPQSSNFNKGVWRELEELTRNWAKKFGQLYVITGPVLAMETKGTIGDNEVSIPAAYFKVLLDLTEPGLKGIAFVIPNEVTFEPLYKFATSIDAVEGLTGLNFFPELMDEDLETEVEGDFNLDLWEFSKKKFEDRTEKWNQQ